MTLREEIEKADVLQIDGKLVKSFRLKDDGSLYAVYPNQENPTQEWFLNEKGMEEAVEKIDFWQTACGVIECFYLSSVYWMEREFGPNP